MIHSSMVCDLEKFTCEDESHAYIEKLKAERNKSDEDEEE